MTVIRLAEFLIVNGNRKKKTKENTNGKRDIVTYFEVDKAMKQNKDTMKPSPPTIMDTFFIVLTNDDL